MTRDRGRQRRHHPLFWIVLILALNEAGWLAFDGGRALIVGDYVTPAEGEYAGRLGPWADFVSAIGIEPRSTLMKSIYFGLGAAWLVVIAGYAFGWNGGWKGMVACAALGLWFLPFGTILGVIQIVLLLLPASRRIG